MNEQETPEIAQIAKSADSAKPQSKPARVRKTAKNKTKAKKKKKSDSHAGRPREPIRYWVEGIEKGKFKGADLVLAIERVEEYEKQRKLKQSSGNADASKLRAILQRAAERQVPAEPKIASEPAVIADAELEETPIPERAPVESAQAEPEPLTIDDLMEQISDQNKKIREESAAAFAARLRDVPASGYDSATETRIWAAVHGMKVH